MEPYFQKGANLMPKYCAQGKPCTQDLPCVDVCTSPLCGDPNLLTLYAPLIYDEIGINICQTLTVDDATFPTLTNADKAFVQILDISFADSTITGINGRPNCTEITLQNIAVTMLIQLYNCSGQLLGNFVGTFTYLPPATDPNYDEDTNPSSVTLELFTPYGNTVTLTTTDGVTTATPLITYIGFTSTNHFLAQGLVATAYPKVLNLDIPNSRITVGLTLVIGSVYFSQYQVPHQGKVQVPKGSLMPQDDSLCLNFVNGDLLELNIKPLELGPPLCEEYLKNDCSNTSCCCNDITPVIPTTPVEE